HDMDMLQWLVGSECVKVSSDGSLAYFRKENAPEGATARCADGCQVEHDCPYSAFKWYYNTSNEFPAKVATLRPDLDDRMQAIKEGPYGRCVYHCDNDVVDHQVATLLFDNGVTVAFTMTGLTLENKRTFAIMGTLGEIVGDDRRNELEVRMFAGKSERIVPAAAKGGHQGADSGIMRDFVRMGGAEGWEVANGKGSGMAARNKTSADVSARSHLIAFALEHSRVTGQAVNMRDYVEQIRTGALDETKM
ncbi:MAG: gfo/Idh/MocA family oxidoreductase, partial [Paenibacillaceae bacterium]|nr:gfo/Idh/MocA family oxidoreductase [Paenibacillaceae bacterium]